MNRLLLAASLVFVLLLAGCYSDQRQQLAACQLQAQSRNRAGETADRAIMQQDSEIELCMGAHGYELIESDCPPFLRFSIGKALATPGSGSRTSARSGFRAGTVMALSVGAGGAWAPRAALDFFCVMHGQCWPLAGPRGRRRVLAAAAAW